MNVVVWVAAGALIGGLTSMFLRTRRPWEIVLNVGIGVCGALLAGWSAGGALASMAVPSAFIIGSLIALSGALVLTALAKMARLIG